jgi:hypothetical protein
MVAIGIDLGTSKYLTPLTSALRSRAPQPPLDIAVIAGKVAWNCFVGHGLV